MVQIALGSGDYLRDTGTGDNDLALVFARSQLVAASWVAGIACANRRPVCVG
ncbi:citrate lyase beta subunit [Prescottella agglutinans]|uniref:Citrate lyase beta subunit n=1 Tax=Prescottella agglutinans TaxID=1644129 RepID=A0ABT6M902_9NOCA|nr:citrate lyase beta subunit [Prescottella agglutinans]